MEGMFKTFKYICEDPYRLVPSKKVIGLTPVDIPEEVIYAAGLLPFWIMGTTAPIKRVTALIPDNACSFARSSLELVLEYQRDFFDGFVISQVDDTTQHMSDLWERRFRDKFFHKFLVPRQLSRPSARFWFEKELHRLKRAIEGFTGEAIQEEKLWESIRLFNEDKRWLLKLYDIKRRSPDLVSNRTFFEAVKASLWMDKEEHLKVLKKAIDELTPSETNDQGEWIPVVLCGLFAEPFEILDLLDEYRLNVVGDNLIVGSRYLYGMCHEEGDVFQALIDRHFSRPNLSPVHDDPFKILNDVTDLFYGSGAKGVIYLHIQYCESQEFDLPDLRRYLREKEIPFFIITTDFQTRHVGLLRTRIEAFRELLLKV
jgi:benzoyl-CoA reductase/2-hydroxyglutaryl-CoA dehydratase subunit BcrC/BadD/HgdB